MVDILKLERKSIYEEIKSMQKDIEHYLDYCSHKVGFKMTLEDMKGIRLVNRLEQLTNRLHIINDKLELMGLYNGLQRNVK